MCKELISIIVPIYNSAPYLSRCIESIQRQTYSNLEIILVNDGSTDNSGSICDEYSKDDTRIKVIHKKNGGQREACSAGIAIAQGTFIGFVDSDDWIDRDMYESLLEMIGENDIVTSGIWQHDRTGDMVDKWTDNLPEGIYTNKEELEYLFNNLIIYGYYDGRTVIGGISNNMVCKLFKASNVKKMYQNANIPIKSGEDFLFCLLYIFQCKSIKITHKCYYHYMNNSTSVTHSIDLDFLRQSNDLYLAIDKALKGHWMEDSLRKQFQRRFMYTVFVDIKKYMQFNDEIGIPTYAYPYAEDLKGKRVVLFGAGKVGRSFYRDIERKKDINVVLWIDNFPPKEFLMGVKVELPNQVNKVRFDYIVCAVLKEKQAEIMKEQLIREGVKGEKILWREPICPLKELFLM
ncbi:putative glycosyltransferase EpsJ [Lachnospiraceae bacterium]|nr:putative glycosyltransferase EpsJ [Lachnospiraceae bacterium]